MSKSDIMKLAAALIIGGVLCWVIWATADYWTIVSPCRNGDPISETPNYCMNGGVR